jgi:hypothetical protein
MSRPEARRQRAERLLSEIDEIESSKQRRAPQVAEAEALLVGRKR